MNTSSKIHTARKIFWVVLAVISVLIVALMVCSNGDLTARIRAYLGIVPAEDSQADFVRIIDIGQGDSILVHSNGSSVLIDTGDVGTDIDLCTKLNSYGIRQLDAALITHYHTDHVGGLCSVAERFSLTNLILPEMHEPQEGTNAAKEASKVVRDAKGGVYTAVRNMNIEVGDFDIKVLYYAGIELSDENNRSLLLMASIGDIDFLLTGDAEKAAEKLILDAKIDIDCEVLKVGHHGSSTSTSERFLKAASPDYAVISCGKDNTYGHPSADVLSLLETEEIDLYRTDISGDITFYVEDNSIRVQTEY